MKKSELALIFISMATISIISYLENASDVVEGVESLFSPVVVLALSLLAIAGFFILAVFLISDKKPLNFKLIIEKKQNGKNEELRPIFKFKNNLEDETIYIVRMWFATIDEHGNVIETKERCLIRFTNGLAVEPKRGWLEKTFFDFKSLTEHGIKHEGKYVLRGQIWYIQDSKEKTIIIDKKWKQKKGVNA